MDHRYLDKEELAAAFEVSLTTVTNWVRRGCPYEARGGKGKPWKFSLPKVLDWHRQYHGEHTAAPGSNHGTGVELPDILRRRPDYRNPLRGVAEDFAKDVFYHWLDTYSWPFLMFCQEAGLAPEKAFKLYQQTAYLHLSAIVDAVGEDFISRGFGDLGDVDAVWCMFSGDRIITRPPPEPDEQVEFVIPEWLRLKPGDFVSQYWKADVDGVTIEDDVQPSTTGWSGR